MLLRLVSSSPFVLNTLPIILLDLLSLNLFHREPLNILIWNLNFLYKFLIFLSMLLILKILNQPINISKVLLMKKEPSRFNFDKFFNNFLFWMYFVHQNYMLLIDLKNSKSIFCHWGIICLLFFNKFSHFFLIFSFSVKLSMSYNR